MWHNSYWKTRSPAATLSSNHTIRVLWLSDNPFIVVGVLLIKSTVNNQVCQHVEIDTEYESDEDDHAEGQGETITIGS